MTMQTDEEQREERDEEREFIYREWCKGLHLDPEDTQTMRFYQEWEES